MYNSCSISFVFDCLIAETRLEKRQENESRGNLDLLSGYVYVTYESYNEVTGRLPLIHVFLVFRYFRFQLFDC